MRASISVITIQEGVDVIEIIKDMDELNRLIEKIKFSEIEYAAQRQERKNARLKRKKGGVLIEIKTLLFGDGHK